MLTPAEKAKLLEEKAQQVFDQFVRIASGYGVVDKKLDVEVGEDGIVTIFTTASTKVSKKEGYEIYYKAQGAALDLNIRLTEMRGIDPYKMNVGLVYLAALEDGSRRNAILEIWEPAWDEDICYVEVQLIEID